MSTTIQYFLNKYHISNVSDLRELILSENKNVDVDIVYRMAEYLNPNRLSNSAYYTDNLICKEILDNLPTPNKKCIKVLEPSVGAGVFIPFILERFKDVFCLEIYIVDIDEEILDLAKLIFDTYYADDYKNVKLFCINDNYLFHSFDSHYFDYVIGNPPFQVLKGNDLNLNEYRKRSGFSKTRNLFSFFLEKTTRDGKFVSLIVPKTILSAPEHDEIRDFLSHLKIYGITDFGELGFKGVLIETINLYIDVFGQIDNTFIKSFPKNISLIQKQDYITDKNYPSWILYRDDFFDAFASNLTFGVFDCFRDRQITSKLTKPTGKIRVLKSRNIQTNFILDIPGYDSYINDISSLSVKKFLNQDNIVCVPNLTYYPRATFLPKNCVADGSVALLSSSIKVNSKQLELYETDEFRHFYAIARNYSTRSLNVDKNSVYYFGVQYINND